MDIVASILQNKEIEDAERSINVEKAIEVYIDPGTLLALDSNAFETDNFRTSQEEYIRSLTRDNVQLLATKLWGLPTERVDETIIVKLPKPTFILPRARVVPKPKPLTKWQQFAKEKGIKKKKRDKSKLQWDEELNKWIPTFGYQRAKAEEQKDWVIEVKENNQPKLDPREAKSTAKQERVAKNELQRLRNLAKAKNVKIPRVGLPTTEQFASAKHLATAKTIARVSTASVGKFQNKLPKEKDAKDIAKEVPGMKKKRKAPPLNVADEKRRNTDLANDIISKKKSTMEMLRVDVPPAPEIPSTKTGGKRKAGRQTNARKPKGGKGKRDPHTKVGGRKRRQ